MKRVEQIICNFLWHVQGNARAHWIKWADVCLPIERPWDKEIKPYTKCSPWKTNVAGSARDVIMGEIC